MFFKKILKKITLPKGAELVWISTIIALASFLRLYKISDYMTFLGDEGRDMLVAKAILDGNLTLLGPRASAGDFFLGPIYYYMITPFLWLSRLDPVGPAIMVALFGIATVYLVYYVGKTFFSSKAGLFAAGLYAVSPLVIAYSRSSWNPNPMPFFALLSLYLLYVAVQNGSWKLFLFVGFLLGISMQLHYLSVFLGVIIFLFVLIGMQFVKKGFQIVQYVKNYLLLGGGFLIGLSPFLLFEARHNFPNIKTIFGFIFMDNVSRSYITNQSFLTVVKDVFFRLFARLVTKFPPPEQVAISESPFLVALQIGTFVFAIVTIVYLFMHKDKLKVLLLSVWLFVGILLFGIYKRPIYDYYLGFMFPLPFLLVGNFLSKVSDVSKKTKIGLYLSIALFSILFVYNLWGSPFRYPANRQKDQAKTIADFVLSKTDGKSFNFALITDGNSDHVYRYFFEVAHREPVTLQNTSIDPQRKSVTQQLLIVCENLACQPLGNPLWEVAGFGRAVIVGQWDVSVVKVYKLVHYSES